jgi:hypothetical protein
LCASNIPQTPTHISIKTGICEAINKHTAHMKQTSILVILTKLSEKKRTFVRVTREIAQTKQTRRHTEHIDQEYDYCTVALYNILPSGFENQYG